MKSTPFVACHRMGLSLLLFGGAATAGSVRPFESREDFAVCRKGEKNFSLTNQLAFNVFSRDQLRGYSCYAYAPTAALEALEFRESGGQKHQLLSPETLVLNYAASGLSSPYREAELARLTFSLYTAMGSAEDFSRFLLSDLIQGSDVALYSPELRDAINSRLSEISETLAVDPTFGTNARFQEKWRQISELSDEKTRMTKQFQRTLSVDPIRQLFLKAQQDLARSKRLITVHLPAIDAKSESIYPDATEASGDMRNLAAAYVQNPPNGENALANEKVLAACRRPKLWQAILDKLCAGIPVIVGLYDVGLRIYNQDGILLPQTTSESELEILAKNPETSIAHFALVIGKDRNPQSGTNELVMLNSFGKERSFIKLPENELCRYLAASAMVSKKDRKFLRERLSSK